MAFGIRQVGQNVTNPIDGSLSDLYQWRTGDLYYVPAGTAPSGVLDAICAQAGIDPVEQRNLMSLIDAIRTPVPDTITLAQAKAILEIERKAILAIIKYIAWD